VRLPRTLKMRHGVYSLRPKARNTAPTPVFSSVWQIAWELNSAFKTPHTRFPRRPFGGVSFAVQCWARPTEKKAAPPQGPPSSGKRDAHPTYKRACDVLGYVLGSHTVLGPRTSIKARAVRGPLARPGPSVRVGQSDNRAILSRVLSPFVRQQLRQPGDIGSDPPRLSLAADRRAGFASSNME
jgi:hypothetical protein